MTTGRTTVAQNQDPPAGLAGKVETYKGFRICKFTDFYMQPNAYAFVAAPEDRWYVRMPNGLWLYSEEDSPNDILVFFKPRYARQIIDRYLGGQRRFEDE